MRTVSIVGIGQTKFGKYPDRSLKAMAKEAGEAAILDSGIDKKDIQACFIGSYGCVPFCTQNFLSAVVVEVLGLPGIPHFRTEAACSASSIALRMATMAIAAGFYDVILVGGLEKMTHMNTAEATEKISYGADVEEEVPRGMTAAGMFATVANRYFYEYRNVKKEMAMNAFNAHQNGLLNPYAHMRKAVDMEKILNAPMVCDPLGLFDCSLVTDGAAFAVLAASDIAESVCTKHRIIDIAGFGHGGDTMTQFSKRGLTSFLATTTAAAEAYGRAGLKPSDIDFAEVHDCFTITQIINTEDLGFFAPGKGGDAVAEGITARDGRLPINPSGGLKSKGHPIGATGVGQVVEVARQIRGEAGEGQIKKADIGLTHNLGGGAAGSCVINILKGR